MGTIRVLARKGQTNSEIARTLGVSEGTIRYQKKRLAEDREDGRTGRSFKPIFDSSRIPDRSRPAS